MGEQELRAKHDKFMLEKRQLQHRRRNCLTALYTNAVNYEDLGIGIKMLIDYTITLEDLVPTTLGMEMKSYDGLPAQSQD